MNELDLINNRRETKLTYKLWLKDWKKRHCERCLIRPLTPTSCYLCFQKRQIGFRCAFFPNFIYHSEVKVCSGLYDTGSCFCNNCQELIRKWLKERKCSCEFSLGGYSDNHSIHYYRSTINGLVKPLFKGSKLWINLACRSCEKTIQTFKLNCSCYLEQKKHQHLYSKKRCLNCVVGLFVRELSKKELRKKYKNYCQSWQERAEVEAEISIKKQYQYDGVNYWAECSFCEGEIRGKQKDKEPLSRNKVSFWTGKEIDGRIICNDCLRKKEQVKLLGGLSKIKKQMLYNYRLRGIV